MEKYDFDQVIDRRGTGAMKYDQLDVYFGCHDITPMWIADMDFESCPEVVAALRRRLEHPVLGYTQAPDTYWNAIVDWQSRRHGFETSREELTFVPGVVKGLALAINFFSSRGDKIVIQPPVYHPFKMVIEGNGREVVNNPLKETSDGWTMDIEGLRAIVEEHHPKMMILCNPHNPIGIQWTVSQLSEVAAIAAANDMVVVADEIHGDLMLHGRRHVPFLSVSPEAQRVGVMLGAPSKTFNIPGMVSSWFMVKNPEMRKAFYSWLETNEFDAPTMMATIAAEAAYREGERWLDQLLPYIEANIVLIREFCNDRMPHIKIVEPEASFLVWLDCRDLGLTQHDLVQFFLREARLALNDGTMFGREGEGFMRLNVACPRSQLMVAMERLAEAYNKLRL